MLCGKCRVLTVLATAVKGSTSISYKYGADGLRTQKTVGSTVYNYYYADGRLVRQTWGSNYMDFLYDESGSAYSPLCKNLWKEQKSCNFFALSSL